MPLPPDDSAFANAEYAAICAFPAYSTTFNVKSAPYNAAGDGTTDDSVAVNAAIDAAIAGGGHAFIYFPTGVYALRTLNDTHTTDLYQALINLTNDGARSMNNLCFIGDHDTDGTPLSTIKGYMPSLADPVTSWQESPYGLSRFIMFYQSPQDGLSPSNVQFRSLIIDGNAGYTGDVTVSGSYKYATATKAAGGTGYQAGDVLTPVVDGNNPQVAGFETEQAQITVNTVSSGVITAITLSNGGRYRSIVTSHTFAVTGGHGSGFTFSCTSALTGDGWDISHKAFMIWRASNVLIYNCDVKNWRGEQIYGGTCHGVRVINGKVRGSNASAISISADLIVADVAIGGSGTDAVYNGTECFCLDSADQQLTVKRCTITAGLSGGNALVYIGRSTGCSFTAQDSEVNGRLLLSELATDVTVDNCTFPTGAGVFSSFLNLYPQFPDGFHNWTFSNNTFTGTALTTSFLNLQNGISDGLVVSGNTIIAGGGATHLLGGAIYQPGAVFSDNVLSGGAIDMTSDAISDSDHIGLWTGTRRPVGIGSMQHGVNTSGNGDTSTILPRNDYEKLQSDNSNAHYIEIDDTQMSEMPDAFQTHFRLDPNGSGLDFTLKNNSAWNALGSDVTVYDDICIRLNGSRKFAVVVLPLVAGTLTAPSLGGTTASLSYATVIEGKKPYSHQLKRSTVSGSGYSNVGSPQSGVSFSLLDTGLSLNTNYYYVVVSTDALSNSVTSAELHIKTGSSAVDLLTGLAGYYKCDESSGDLADATGNGHTLTNTNTGTFAAGKINNGFSVTDGVSDQYATDSGHAIMSGTKTKVSFAGWMKRPDHTADKMFVGYGDDTSHYLVMLPYTDNTIYAYAGTNGDVDTFSCTDDGSWHHYAFVYDGTQATAANRVKVYRDGVALTSTGGGGGTFVTSYPITGNFRIGKVSGGSAGYIGSYDEWAVYDGVALDASQVAALYATGSGVQWPFSTPTAGTLAQTAVTATTASLSYGTVANGLAPYSNQLRRSLTSGSGYSNVGSPVVGATVSFSDSGLTASTDYYYIVLTTDNASQTATSNEVHVTTSAAAVVTNHLSFWRRPLRQLRRILR